MELMTITISSIHPGVLLILTVRNMILGKFFLLLSTIFSFYTHTMTHLKYEYFCKMNILVVLFMYTRNSIGPKTVPWGIPVCTIKSDLTSWPSLTCCILSVRYFFINSEAIPGIP